MVLMSELTRAAARKVQAVLIGYFLYCTVAAMVIWTMFDGAFAVPLWLAVGTGPVALYAWRRSLADLLRPAMTAGRDELVRMLGPLESVGYAILRDVDLGRGSVDVLVIGPSGIYAIECTAWPGTFGLKDAKLTRSGMSAGRLVGRTATAADLVARRLQLQGIDAPVTPVLALTRSRLRDGSISLRRVHVLRADALATWIHRRPVKFETLGIERALHALA